MTEQALEMAPLREIPGDPGLPLVGSSFDFLRRHSRVRSGYGRPPQADELRYADRFVEVQTSALTRGPYDRSKSLDLAAQKDNVLSRAGQVRAFQSGTAQGRFEQAYPLHAFEGFDRNGQPDRSPELGPAADKLRVGVARCLAPIGLDGVHSDTVECAA